MVSGKEPNERKVPTVENDQQDDGSSIHEDTTPPENLTDEQAHPHTLVTDNGEEPNKKETHPHTLGTDNGEEPNKKETHPHTLVTDNGEESNKKETHPHALVTDNGEEPDKKETHPHTLVTDNREEPNKKETHPHTLVMDNGEEPNKKEMPTKENGGHQDDGPSLQAGHDDPTPPENLKDETTPQQNNYKAVSISTGDFSNTSVYYSVAKKNSKDASTNTPSLGPGSIDLIYTFQDDIDGKKQKNTDFIQGVVMFHEAALKILPRFRKFCFCVPLRYGVYTIISYEEIYFSLRSYSMILHLAMPYFFPQLKVWLATIELLLCLGIMISGLFLLFGAFINPIHILIWIDIHILEMVIFVTLSLWMSITGYELVYQYSCLFIAYIIIFIYSILIVNSFRMGWETFKAGPSDTGPTVAKA